MDLFSDQVMVSLVKELDAGALRQRVMANNIANVNTPYFKKTVVEFDSLLKKALGREPVEMITTDPRHFGGKPSLAELRPEVSLSKETTMRTDGNNVDIDEEMTNLAANSMQYQAVAKELSERYSGLSYVITGGRR
ncbi:flagellar basal body rod protein FlgB [Pelotomaculum isophthalicicum JI]|uniref:Flagellar basal body rod protein FlgB n=1 Tax=Pelotomaculum isophthalicicum JI TaxID=947010 RepID=A0A9X4JW08_9FIRM|nr:flagellar basal body rod protein FlgB [Pelotomaculum isophthalicicum]MDF9409296.1 flagellar basal body rod protein FlgB [Pelotomaculum isophthalicicum JI]